MSLLETANDVIEYHISNRSEDYKKLEAFAKDVKLITLHFTNNKIPDFSLMWNVKGVNKSISWDGTYFIYHCPEYHSTVLGAKAEVRLWCMEKFDEFLKSFTLE